MLAMASRNASRPESYLGTCLERETNNSVWQNRCPRTALAMGSHNGMQPQSHWNAPLRGEGRNSRLARGQLRGANKNLLPCVESNVLFGLSSGVHQVPRFAGNDTNRIKKALECYVVKSPRSGVLVQIRCKPHVAGLVGRGVR